MGLDIYAYVYRSLLPRKDFHRYLSEGRPLPNPFVAGGQLLIECRDGLYEHHDLTLPAFKGNALDLAGHYFKPATQHELYFLINQQLCLGLRIPAEELCAQLESREVPDQQPQFSYFEPPISNTRPSGTMTLPQLYRRISSTELQQVTQQLRQQDSPAEARKFKASHFPYVTFGGRFEKRSDKHLLQPSGLMVIDLDDVPEMAAVRKALIAEVDYETQLLFTSPSGRGLKWITSYLPQQISHLDYFRLLCSYLEAMYGLRPDESGKDISRACFISWDEDPFIHWKYLT